MDETSAESNETHTKNDTSDASDDKVVEHEEKSHQDSTGSEDDKDYDTESGDDVSVERECGDGQESQPTKKIDDDEDKKNPQYIPKRGTFYEHDDRTDATEEGETVEAEKIEKDPKRKVWQDKKEKWSHDRFNDFEQAPKSKAELIAIYGYDIRKEDGPPKPRRRRRYGRGPNKYTRNWEDEDAYTKTVPVIKKKTPKKPGKNEGRTLIIERSEVEENSKEPVEETQKPPEKQSAPSTSTSSTKPSYGNRFPQQPHVGSGRVPKPRKEIKDSDYKGFTTKTRLVRNMKNDNEHTRNNENIPTQTYSNGNVQDLEKYMMKMNFQDNNEYVKNGKHNTARQGSVPPRLQSEQKGSKRYSSIRQRSLPDASTPSFNQHPSFYPNDYNQQGQVPPQNLIASTTQVSQIAPPPLPPIPPVPVTATQILQATPQFAPPFPQAPPPSFMQAGVGGPFIPHQQPAPLINYVPNQAQFPPQGFQGYQQTFGQVTQPTELFQSQSGITYYSTDHQVTQRAVPQKRPKAAIPIVPPPGNEHRSDEENDGNSETKGVETHAGTDENLVAARE